MGLDITTLAIIASIMLIIQLFVLSFQQQANKDFKGNGCWVLGSLLISLGTTMMLFYRMKYIQVLAIIANPLVVLGYIALHIGILRFKERPVPTKLLIFLFGIFTIAYYYFMFFYSSITLRTISINLAIFCISSLMVKSLLFTRQGSGKLSANLTASAFLLTALFSIFRLIFAVLLPPIQNYQDQHLLLELAFLVQIISGAIWTYGFVLMVSQRINYEHDVEREKMQLIFNTSPDAAMITRLSDGLIVDVNIGFTLISGYNREEVVGQTISSLKLMVNPELRPQFISELQDKGASKNHEFFFRKKNGIEFMGSISAGISTFLDQPHIISIIHDVTERNQQQLALAESEALYRSILNASPDDITITDLKGNILMVSPASKKMFGYPDDEQYFIGQNIIQFLLPEDKERANTNMTRLFSGQTQSSNEYRAVRFDQTIFHIEVSSDFIKNAIGMPNKIIFIIRDITARIIAQQQIKLLLEELDQERNIAQINAITDSLTDIANRRYFDVIIQSEFTRLKRTNSSFSLIMIDVDRFKHYNDQFGHLAGDHVLKSIGSLLKVHAHRGSDFVARYGGEEFVVLLPDTDSLGAQLVAESIRFKVESLDTIHPVTISLGVVTVTQHQVKTGEEAILFADKALYHAKENGRNQFVVYDFSHGHVLPSTP